jgi:hypothetical protein
MISAIATGTAPSVRTSRPGVSSVELIWKVPLPRVAVGTPLGMPSMHELATVAKNLASASSLAAAAAQLQRDACKLLRVTNAACIWIDWPRRIASTIDGRLGEQLEELVIEVAGCGRRSLLGSALVEPLGPPGTHARLGCCANRRARRSTPAEPIAHSHVRGTRRARSAWSRRAQRQRARSDALAAQSIAAVRLRHPLISMPA